jgi:hypothetical protein
LLNLIDEICAGKSFAKYYENAFFNSRREGEKKGGRGHE